MPTVSLNRGEPADEEEDGDQEERVGEEAVDTKAGDNHGAVACTRSTSALSSWTGVRKTH